MSERRSAENPWRGDNYSLPLAMGPGDMLSDGRLIERVEKGDGSKVILLPSTGNVIVVDKDLPLQLHTGRERRGVLPTDLVPGHILRNGDVVLDNPEVCGYDAISRAKLAKVKLTGGTEGREVFIPTDVELAVYEEVYPDVDPSRIIGAMAVANVMGLSPELAQKIS